MCQQLLKLRLKVKKFHMTSSRGAKEVNAFQGSHHTLITCLLFPVMGQALSSGSLLLLTPGKSYW